MCYLCSHYCWINLIFYSSFYTLIHGRAIAECITIICNYTHTHSRIYVFDSIPTAIDDKDKYLKRYTSYSYVTMHITVALFIKCTFFTFFLLIDCIICHHSHILLCLLLQFLSSFVLVILLGCNVFILSNKYFTNATPVVCHLLFVWVCVRLNFFLFFFYFVYVSSSFMNCGLIVATDTITYSWHTLVCTSLIQTLVRWILWNILDLMSILKLNAKLFFLSINKYCMNEGKK